MNVCLIDDHTLIRQGLISIISNLEGVNVLADFSDAPSFLNWLKLAEDQPDVILLDVELPGMNGIQLMEWLRESYPDIKILMVTMHVRESLIAGLVDKGVHGYLSKNSQAAEMEAALNGVYQQGYYFSSDVLQALHRSRIKEKKRAEDQTYGYGITEREKQVLEMICKELSSSEIAEKLFISSRTVEGHRNNLLQKSGAKNMAGLVLFAVRNGIVDPWF